MSTVAYVLIWILGVIGGVLVGYGYADWLEELHDR